MISLVLAIVSGLVLSTSSMSVHLRPLFLRRRFEINAASSPHFSGRSMLSAKDPPGFVDAFESAEALKETYAVHFRDTAIAVKPGSKLRTALLKHCLTPHNGKAKIVNCRGLGTCGTCAVEIVGKVSPPERTAIERARLNLPPFTEASSHLRLACQVQVQGDLQVTKYNGFWGQGTERSEDTDFALPLGDIEFILDQSERIPPPSS